MTKHDRIDSLIAIAVLGGIPVLLTAGLVLLLGLNAGAFVAAVCILVAMNA